MEKSKKKTFGFGEKFAGVSLGDQIVTKLQAAPGGVAEQVLRFIAKTDVVDGAYARTFSDWQDADAGNETIASNGLIEVFKPGRDFIELPLELAITKHPVQGEGIFTLLDVSDPKYVGTFSGKELRPQVLAIGPKRSISAEAEAALKRAEQLTPLEMQVRHAATSILATWVIRGKPWVAARLAIMDEASKARKKRRENLPPRTREKAIYNHRYLFGQ